MTKFKTFIIGFILGSALMGGITFASSKMHLIEVGFPNITYLINDVEMKPYPDENVPTTIQYKGFNYVPIRYLTDAMDQEIEWNAEQQEIHVYDTAELTFEQVTEADTPETLHPWIERSQQYEMVQFQNIGSDTYVLITRGVKSTGGYDLTTETVKQRGEGVVITLSYVDPPSGAPLVEEMTYPYALIKLSDISVKEVTVKETTGKFIPHLIGINHLASSYEETDNLIIFPLDQSEDSIIISGITRSFEGVLGYTKINSLDEIEDEGSIVAEGAAPNWAYFEKKIPSADWAELSVLELYTLNAKDGSKREVVSIEPAQK